MNTLCQQISDLSSQLDALVTSQDAEIKRLTSQDSALAADAASWVTFSRLEAAPVYAKDTKTPFQWIQPGNVGNTGGGSSDAHGTFTWHPSDAGTRITVTPAHISPKSDDFFFYMVLPYPESAPLRLRASARNWSCASPADFSSCQQIEGPQLEYLGGGFQYTLCYSVTGRGVLQYWAGVKKWQPVPNAPTFSLGRPTPIAAEFAIDPTAHTYTYVSLRLGDRTLTPAVTVPAIAIPESRRELSVAVQLDGRANAAPYAAVLDRLTASYSLVPAAPAAPSKSSTPPPPG